MKLFLDYFRKWHPWKFFFPQGSKSGGNSTKKDSFFDRTGLKQKNKALAATLNNTRLQNAALCQKLNQMNGEIFEVKGEIVELKREKQAIAATARLTESDIQRKLEVRDFKIPLFSESYCIFGVLSFFWFFGDLCLLVLNFKVRYVNVSKCIANFSNLSDKIFWKIEFLATLKLRPRTLDHSISEQSLLSGAN